MLVDENDQLIAGEARYRAGEQLGLTKIPIIRIRGLSLAKRRALAIADNRIHDNARWDRQRLTIEIPELTELLNAEGLDVSILGFEPLQVEALQVEFQDHGGNHSEKIDAKWARGPAVSKVGDLWLLGEHKLLCGGSDPAADIVRLMTGCRADLAFLNLSADPAERVGRAKAESTKTAGVQRRWPCPTVRRGLKAILGATAKASRRGATHGVCIDPQHFAELLIAAGSTYGAMLGLNVWVKPKLRQDARGNDRPGYALIGVFRRGATAALGSPETPRANVWRYGSIRTNAIAALPRLDAAVPVALVADLIADGTRPGNVVLDPFAGLGSTVMAAEQLGRRARACETPQLVDLIIRRWQAATGRHAVHVKTGRRFDQIAVAANGASNTVFPFVNSRRQS